LGLLI